MIRFFKEFAVLFVFAVPSAIAIEPGAVKSDEAVAEVMAGKRAIANAAWWGFDPEDSTDALQAAIRSGAKKVIVPAMGRDWIVRPISLAGDQELVLEAGVVIAAKRGEYRGAGDSVFTAQDIKNLTIRGYGATIRMNKRDYIVGKVLVDLDWNRWFGQYQKAEWRMTLALRGCENVKIYGLTLRESGGDGIYVDGGANGPPRDIYLRDVVCDDNYRQGISIIDVDGFIAENCTFSNTWGTPPCSGVDIEPDGEKDRIKNVVFRNCRFEDNYGDGIEVFLTNMKQSSGDVSILFENCRVSSRYGAGIRVTKIHDDGPGGLIEFRDCVVDGVEGYGIKVQEKSADRARVRFVNCRIRAAARNRAYADVWSPIVFRLTAPEKTARFGGIEFVDCAVEDEWDRPAIGLDRADAGWGIFDVIGSIKARNQFGVRGEEAVISPNTSLTLTASDN